MVTIAATVLSATLHYQSLLFPSPTFLPRIRMTVRHAFADILLVLLACLCPPAIAWIKTKKKDLLLSFLLTLLLWAPGIFRKYFRGRQLAGRVQHTDTDASDAWYLILTHPESQRERVTEQQVVKDVERADSERSIRTSEVEPVEMHPVVPVSTPPAVAAVVEAPLAARETAKVQERGQWGRDKKQPPAYEV